MTRMLMRFRHWLGITNGRVVTWWHGEWMMVGIRCECGDMHNVHPVVRNGKFVTRERIAGGGR